MAMPPGGPFDFNALQSALNDPAIKQMAEQIATDPSFREMTEQLQQSMAGMLGGPGGMGAAGAAPAVPNPAMMENFNPQQYMEAMSGMFQNPSFMLMAEKLGKAIIDADPHMAQMMKTMQDPSYRNKVQEAMQQLKDDPEISPLLAEIEQGGPAAMMKYWNDPSVLSKLGQAMGDAFELPPGAQGAIEEGDREGEQEEEEEEEEGEATVHTAASDGDAALLKTLLDQGANVDEADEEGRTALHFACGYGELECAKLLLDHKANLDSKDNNDNTALHYAAGYGQADAVKLLIESGADVSITNQDGKTALEVATLNEQEEVAKLLEGAEKK